MEAERGAGIRERLMEYELDGDFTFAGEDGAARAVRLRAKIDRVDLLDDGTFRLIDYKTKYVPDRRQALQLPIYSECVRTSLSKTHGRDIRASEAMYLSFEGPQAVVPLEERGKVFEELTASAGASARYGARRHCRRPLSGTARDPEPVHDVRVRGGLPASGRPGRAAVDD